MTVLEERPAPGRPRRLDEDAFLPQTSGQSLRRALVAIDSAATAFGWLVPLALSGRLTGAHPELGWAAGTCVVAVTLATIALHQLYRSRVCSVRAVEIARLARAAIAGGIVAVLFDRVTGLNLPLPVATIGVMSTFASLVLARGAFRNTLQLARRTGRFLRPIVVVGCDEEAADLIHLLKTHPEHGFWPVGIIGDSEGMVGDSVPLLGPVSSTVAAVRKAGATGALVVGSSLGSRATNRVVRDLIEIGVHVHVSTGLRGIAHSRVRPLPLAHEPLFYVEPLGLAGWQLAVKRAVDLVVATIALVASLPILLTAAVLVKLQDRGPVLFRQVRVGLHGDTFTILKLRTMVPNAEKMYGDLAPSRKGRDGPLIKLAEDPRRTKIGRVLERLSIDELPQLINVLRGEMSLVGPRPAQPAEVAEFDEELRARLEVRPGITGLWQVEARDNPSFSAYRRYDLFYLENWSVQLDLAILVATAERVLFRALKDMPADAQHMPASEAVAPTTLTEGLMLSPETATN